MEWTDRHGNKVTDDDLKELVVALIDDTVGS